MTKDILTQLDLLYFKRGSTICGETGESLNVAGVEFSTLSQAVLLIKRQMNGIKTHAHLELITQPIFCRSIKTFLKAASIFKRKKCQVTVLTLVFHQLVAQLQTCF
jgi:hypothetical protein